MVHSILAPASGRSVPIAVATRSIGGWDAACVCEGAQHCARDTFELMMQALLACIVQHSIVPSSTGKYVVAEVHFSEASACERIRANCKFRDARLENSERVSMS